MKERKQRKKRNEMKVLTVMSVLALIVGASSIWGAVAKWDQVAYASSQQVWNQANLASNVSQMDKHVNALSSSGKPYSGLGAERGEAKLTSLPAAASASVSGATGTEDSKLGSEAIAAKPQGKTVYLTFDDGPSEHTATVLDILKKNDIKGTFFVLGQQVKQNPKLMKRIADEGHAVGNHSYNHNYTELYSSFKDFWSQIRKTGQAIKDVIGYEPALVRAPGGTYLNFNKQYFDLMKQAGYAVVDWNVDTGDSKRVGVPAKEIIATVKQSPLSNSVIVLMHDGVGHGETAKALPDIIKYYQSKGYTFDVLTADQEPVQFRIATKERWTRTAVSKAWIADNVANVKVDGKPDEPDAKPEWIRFLVKSSLGELTFEPNQHMSHDEMTYVPIRTFVEQLGGSVQYDAAAGQYILAFNNTLWTIDRKSGSMAKLLEDGSSQPLEWNAVQENSMYWVPLRSLLEQSGGVLLQYELAPVQEEAAAAA